MDAPFPHQAEPRADVIAAQAMTRDDRPALARSRVKAALPRLRDTAMDLPRARQASRAGTRGFTLNLNCHEPLAVGSSLGGAWGHGPAEPGAGVGPVAVGGARRDPQGGGGLIGRQPGEVPQLHQLGLFRMLLRETVEGLVESEELVVRDGSGDSVEIEILPLPAAAVSDSLLAAGLLDENTADGLGRRREEMSAAVELLVAHQPQVCFMHQGGRVERLARLLLRELRGGELAQLVIDERQQIRGRLLVATVGCFEESCYVGHGY